MFGISARRTASAVSARRLRCSWFLVLTLSFTATPLIAAPQKETQEPQETFKDRIEVTGEAGSTLTAPGLAAAQKEVETIAGGASVLDAEPVRNGRASTLDDVLAFAPGVVVQPRFGAEETRLSIRGSGLQRTFHGRGLKLLQDGVPLNLADGGFDFQAVEPLSARYVQVLRGANGLALGSSTLGGAINFVTPSGRDATPWNGRIEGGDFGYLRGQAAASFARDRFDFLTSLSHFEQDGFRDHARQNTQRLFGNLGFRADESRESRVYWAAVRTDSELPGSLTRAQLNANPRQAAAGNVALDQKRDFDLLRLSTKNAWLASERSRFEWNAYGSQKHLDHPIFQVIDQRSLDLGADLRFERSGEVRGRAHRFLVGFAPALGTVDDRRFVNVSGRRGAATAKGDTDSQNLDLYAEERVELRANWTLTAGFVASHATRDFDDRFLTDGDQTDRQSFNGFSPKLGVIWQARPNLSVFANVAQSFEPPSFGELVNRGGDGLLALEEQTATSIELGSRGGGTRFGWEAVLYHARLDGELLSLNDPTGNPLGTINADRTIHRGAEVGWQATVVSRDPWRLSFHQVYTWNDFRFDGDRTFGNRRLAGVPEHLTRSELRLEMPHGLSFATSLASASRSPIDHANTLSADSWSTLNARLSWNGAGGWKVFVDGRNLGDETYAATTGVVADARGRDSAQFLPGDGRSVFFGFEVRR